MPLHVQHCLYTLILVQVIGMELASGWDLLVDEFELLDGQEHGQVTVRAVEFVRGPLSQMQWPLLDVDDLVTKVAKFQVAEVFPEVVYALFGEKSLNVEVSVA